MFLEDNMIVRRRGAWRLAVALFCLPIAGFGQSALVSTFPAGDSSWHLGTLAAAHLDDSPGEELVVPYRDSTGAWYLDAFRLDGQRMPGFPYYSGGDVMNVSPTIYDLDGDGRDEIIFTRANHVIVLRGNGSVMWSNTVDSANYIPDGGYQTLTNRFYWSATKSFINHLPSTAVFSSEVSPPMVMDLNGKGSPEIVTAWKIDPDPNGDAQDYNPFINDIYGSSEWGATGETWSGGVVTFNPATGGQNFVYHFCHLVEAGVAVGRANPSGPLDIYVLNDSDSVVAFDKSQPFGFWGKGMLHKQFGKAQRLHCGSYLQPMDMYTADIDGDGLDECLVSGTQLGTLWQPNETILDDDGAILWRRFLPQIQLTHNYGWLNSSCLIPVNPDHDNHADVLGFNHSYEITFRYWNGAELVDHPGWPKNFYPYLPTPPVVGDVDGDGHEEIIIGAYLPAATPSSGSLNIYALDGTLKQSIPVPGGIKHIPAIADVEGIGRLDVIYRSIPGQVYVRNFGSTSTNLVSWSTHRGNMRRDGNAGRSLFPPGTPLVISKTAGYNRAAFTWTNPLPGTVLYRIYRAEQGTGPFEHIATVLPTVHSYTDYDVKQGWQYFYEVRAVYPAGTVASSPFVITPMYNSNLVANAGFEENGNSHWDKWWDAMNMTNMVASTNAAYEGRQSMSVLLQNSGSDNTISQFNQYGTPDSTLYVTPGGFYSFGGWVKSGGISQPSQQCFMWTSSKTGYDTNNRPGLPWPNYFTPSLNAGTAPTEWTYLNRTFQMPPGIPNVELYHTFNIAAPGSGVLYIDNMFFRPLPNPSATNWTTLIPFGATWRYFTNTPPANWFASGFDDSAWPVGAAKFGAGSGPKNIVTRVAQHRPAYYFRKTFNVDSSDVEEFLLSATCTDDSGSAPYPLRLFLNGNEVKTPIETVTAQGNETRYLDLIPFAGMLRAGPNTIGVIVSNQWSSWDDVAFDISLKAVMSRAGRPKLTLKCSQGANPSLQVEAPAGSVWQIQSADSMSLEHWQPVQTITNVLGAPLVIQDSGQNGRQAAVSTPARFYRVVPF